MGKRQQARRGSGHPARAAEERRNVELRRLEQERVRSVRAGAAGHHNHRDPVTPPNPTETDWARLEAQALIAHPTCPDCGAPMEVDIDNGEEGGDGAGNMIISAWVVCTAYRTDEDEGRQPAPHPLTIDGLGIEYELIVG